MSINDLLIQKGITKYRLWKESGVPQATISDLCSGKTRIEKCSAETIYRIARVLNVSMESLIAPAVQQLDEERKAAMVSNLLVVLCGNKDAQPIVNSGSLY